MNHVPPSPFGVSKFSLVAALTVALLGLSVLWGWHLGWTTWVQPLPGQVPMQYNTAACLVVLSLGLVATGRDWRLAAIGCGAGVMLLSGLSLAQYPLGRDFGMDQMLFQSSIMAGTSHPGRMAPNTALCLLLCGAALVADGLRKTGRRSPWVQGTAASVVGGLTLVALLGYGMGLESAFGWGSMTRMAPHTAAALLLLAAGLGAIAWRRSPAAQGVPPAWVPVPAGLGVLTLTYLLWDAVHALHKVSDRSLQVEDGLLLVLALLTSLLIAVSAHLLRRAALQARRASQALQELRADIAARKETERRLVRSETLFRSVFQQQFQFTAILAPDGRVMETNAVIEKDGGVHPDHAPDPGQVLGRFIWETPWWAGLPDVQTLWTGRMALAVHSNEPVLLAEDPFLNKDGQRRVAQASLKAVKNASNELEFFILQGNDITEQLLARDALADSERRLRQAQRIGGIGDWQYELGGGPMRWSEGMFVLFARDPGQAPPDLEGLMDCLDAAEAARLRECLARVAASGEPGELDVRVVLGNGRPSYQHWVAQPRRNSVGEVVALFGIAQDITRRREAQNEVVQLNASLETRVQQRTAQLEAANKELEAFSYSLAHDIRSPLRAVDAFSHVLEQDFHQMPPERVKLFLLRIRAGVQQMGNLTDALLALAQLSRTRLQWEPVDLGALARTELQNWCEREPQRRVSWTVEPGLQVMGDPRLLLQVMQNLVGNAWKFTGRCELAEIHVGCTLGHLGEAVFHVKDNGAGFDMSYATKLFGAFERLHTQHDFAGTGIGLANVKRIITRHGGRIWADSQVGHGACFYFTLGLEPDTRPGPPPAN